MTISAQKLQELESQLLGLLKLKPKNQKERKKLEQERETLTRTVASLKAYLALSINEKVTDGTKRGVIISKTLSPGGMPQAWVSWYGAVEIPEQPERLTVIKPPSYAIGEKPQLPQDAPTIASLFTGGGLFEAGAMAAGFRPIWGVEHDPDNPDFSRQIADSYEHNFGGHIIRKSVQEVAKGSFQALERPTVLHISQPCKSFSSANSKTESETDLSAARAACQAIREDGSNFRLLTSDFRLPPMGWLEAIADLIPTLPESQLADWQQQRMPSIQPGKAYLIERTGARKDRDLLVHPGNEPSWTIKANIATDHKGANRHDPLNVMLPDGKVVSLDARAIARLQSVPDWYELPEPIGVAVTLIGNGVPCLLDQRLMEALKPVVSGPIVTVETVPVLEDSELSAEEERDRLFLERKVERAFYEAGKALAELRDRRLYRSTHKTFEDYCRERFAHSRQKANFLIAGAIVYDNLTTICCQNSPPEDEDLTTICCQNSATQDLTTNSAQILPTNEAQCRPLTQLSPDQQRQVWQQAVTEAGSKVPSSRLVRDIVQRVRERTKVPIPYRVGDVCSILVKDNPELRGKGGCRGIVTAVGEFSCTVHPSKSPLKGETNGLPPFRGELGGWDGEYQLQPEYQFGVALLPCSEGGSAETERSPLAPVPPRFGGYGKGDSGEFGQDRSPLPHSPRGRVSGSSGSSVAKIKRRECRKAALPSIPTSSVKFWHHRSSSEVAVTLFLVRMLDIWGLELGRTWNDFTPPKKLPFKSKSFSLKLTSIHYVGSCCLPIAPLGEAVGKTKGTAQKFLSSQADELPPPIKATIPERRGAIALTPAQSALAYWQDQSSQGNETAIALIAAIDDKPLSEFEITSEQAAPTPETEADRGELQLMAEGIEIASRWMAEAGVDKAAIAHWRLNELAQKVPEL